jgi:heme exporter protein B
MSGPRLLLALVGKDLRIELRTREVIAVMALFSLLTVVLFHFSFDVGIDPETLLSVSAGMLWLAFAFSGVLGISRSFSSERQRETLRGLLLAPIDPALIYTAKLLSNLIFLGLVEVVTFPIFGVLLNLPWVETLPDMLAIFFLATLGFVTPGTLFAAASANVRLREAMLPVLLFPITLPALIAGVECTAALLHGRPWSEFVAWVRLLGVFDVIFAVVGVLVFPFLMEE